MSNVHSILLLLVVLILILLGEEVRISL